MADVSKILSLGIVAATDISSGRRSLFRGLAEMRSSVRLACSLSTLRRGVRGKLSPQTFTQELLTCTSHSRDTRRFYSETHMITEDNLYQKREKLSAVREALRLEGVHTEEMFAASFPDIKKHQNHPIFGKESRDILIPSLKKSRRETGSPVQTIIIYRF